MPYFKNGALARCPQCGMNMSLRIGITFSTEYWKCNWTYCSEYNLEITEVQAHRSKQKTQLEFENYRNIVRKQAPPKPNYVSIPSPSNYANFTHTARSTEMKIVNISSMYAGTITTICFKTLPRRGWFAENVTPIIDIIKTAIPATAREYDPNIYTWSIGSEYWPSLEQILTASGWTIKHIVNASAKIDVPKEYAESFHYQQVVIKDVETKESIATQLAALLGIHEDLATIELVALKKKYREMARKYHPDLGGDAAKMSTLNYLWTIYNSGDKVQ